MPKKRYTVAVDFDGVLHSYIHPWVAPHVIPDPPVPGAIAWLVQLRARMDVVIFTTRARTWRGRRAVRRWLNENSNGLLPALTITDRKPTALAYVDDRAMRFDGVHFPSFGTIINARPWHKARAAQKEA